ncbi:MAG: hypothetical protein K5922_05835 [Clostridiales bacterium]|nr:hypothetical protein [Clostridiales bacterium]
MTLPDLSKVTAILPDLADYVVYGAIAIVTLIGVFKCLIPLWSTAGALRRAIRRLQDHAGDPGKPVWQEAGFMGRRMKGSWLRFLQNAEQLDRRGLPTNVEDYINDDTVTHSHGNATLAELIPNLLTSLGILGTFMGLSRGLSSLNFSDASQLISGIPDLLSGMRFAFGTSVAGISCSLIFNMLNRISQGSSYRAIDDFVISFTQLAMSRPLDNDVQLICQNQDRNHMLQGINETLADRLAENVGLAITRAMEPVTGSMDRFIIGATRNQIEGVNRIVSRFLEEMDRSLSGQIQNLGQAMDAVSGNQIYAARQAEETLRSAGGIVQDAKDLRQLTDQVLSRFDAYVAELQETRTRDEAFEKKSAELLSRMEKQNLELTEMIGTLTRRIDAIPDLKTREATDAALAGIREATGSLNESVRAISETLTALSEEV